MRELFIDIETFSPVNLAKSGVYPYADHDDFELLQHPRYPRFLPTGLPGIRVLRAQPRHPQPESRATRPARS